MLRDVFYYGKKPNVHPREKFASSLDDARRQSTTEHFWIINEYCDYRGFDWDFDFEFLPDEDVWAENHNNVWPSIYQKDSGTWLCPTIHSDIIIYRADVAPLNRKNINHDHWIVPDNIDITKFDFGWHPDPTDPPYIYIFPTTWNKVGGPEYHVEGATEKKYITTQIGITLPQLDKWEIPSNVDVSEFDFTWAPHPDDPPYIYQFGTQWQKTGGPRLTIEGATEVKYVGLLKAKALVDMTSWTLPTNIDISGFDFSWHPDDTSPPYVYRFPTQWAMSGGPVYTVAGATEVKYVEDMVAKAIADPERKHWEIPGFIDVDSFDFSWHPYEEDEPFIYQFGTQWQKTGGPRYITPGTHKNSAVKYIDTRIIKAMRLPSKKNFAILNNSKIEDFDYSWHPDTTEEAFTYVFGNQFYSPEVMPTVEYSVPGAKQVKYVHNVIAKLAVDMTNWEVPSDVDTSSFDFSWKPNPNDPPFIYQFGTQWQKTGGPRYTVGDATEIKYMSEMKVKKFPSDDNWEMPEKVNIAEFDKSWHPDATEKPYIYQFGTQWVLTGGPRYVAPGATEVKFIDVDEHHAIAGPELDKWIVPEDIDKESFDFSWHPHPDDPPFVYQFATQWQKTDGPRYIAEDAEDGFSAVKYIDARILKAKRLPTKKNWIVPEGVDVSKFDFSWHPDATAPKYIYQFGTLVDDKDGPRYEPEDNTGEVVYLERTEIKLEEVNFPQYYIKTTLEDLIKEHKNEIFWALRENIDYNSFDFHWIPNKENVYHINVFGSPESEITQTYFVNGKMIEKGYMQMNYVDSAIIDEEYLFNLFKKVDMFFVDRGNPETQSRFDALKQKFPKIQKTRYLNTWVDTINRCINRSTGELCWILNSELDYNGFDFNYYPTPWQMKMIHVFGTQWSHWGTTFLINRETFPEDTKYVKIIEHLPNLNFVKNRTARATNILYDTVYIDHGNRPAPKDVTVVEYDESYLKTFKKMLEKLPTKKEHYIWVISSICDYSHFDFTYICDPFAKDQLHVFPSDRQKFGDTFLIDVNKLRELIVDMAVLEQYKKINYNQHQRVKRLPAPTIITEGDTHVSAIHTDFNWPYATFQTSDNKEINVVDTEPMSLWAPETKNIQITSVGGTRIVVPREVKNYVKRELYDYPYIQTNKTLAKSSPMDIVFLSNGEEGADKNYEHLLKTVEGLPNRVVRVDGVNGRVQAYHAAAEASNTPWLFTVFAKLKVSAKFDWNWQPDRLQVPKHYVFHAKNPVNGLVYGHQAMIAYNKKLTLANQGKGLDFTMDDEHEVLEINSGIAMFNTDEWSTWRTSFREALKLRAENSEISKNRLEFWLTVGMGSYAEYSMEGAQHAVEYYEEVNGDFNKLKLSYEWAWLRKFYESKYKL
jgi:hypothetical protein